MDLDSLKYADLQHLAKSVGLKANMKAEKLLKVLKEHFKQQKSSGNGNNVASSEILKQGVDEVRPSNVTKRRGRGQKAKRKHADQGSSDQDHPSKLEDSPAQDIAIPDEPEDGKRTSKRRKVSSAKGTETPTLSMESSKNQPEAEPESFKNDAVTEQRDKVVGKKTAGRIPRHEGLLKKVPLRPTTPNFKKLHEAHFNKMESIDSYVQRKNKQMEALRNTVKELKAENTEKTGDAKTVAKPPTSRATLFSPVVQEKNPAARKRRLTQTFANKSALKDSAPFRPSVLSVNKINVRFSRGTQDNEHKGSLVKTPARMSPMIPLTPTPGRKSEVATKSTINKNRVSINKTPGKLKPFSSTQENTPLNKSQTIPSHQKIYKQPQVQTREERRIKHTEDRKQKKEKMLGARRGLTVA